MSKFSYLTQLVMIAIAITIGLLYIKPTVMVIRDTQDKIDNYETETANVSSVNDLLRSKLSQIAGVSITDSDELKRFIPDNLDEVNVLKDIQNIMGTNKYPKLRFGIGNQYPKGMQAEFVLGKWLKTEEPLVQLKIEKCIEVIESFVTVGIEQTMTIYNKLSVKP